MCKDQTVSYSIILTSFCHSLTSLSFIISFRICFCFAAGWVFLWDGVFGMNFCHMPVDLPKIFRAALFLCQVFGHLLKSLTSSIQGLHQAWTVESNGFLQLPNQARHCCADLLFWQFWAITHIFYYAVHSRIYGICTLWQPGFPRAVFMWLNYIILQVNWTKQFLLNPSKSLLEITFIGRKCVLVWW